MFEELKSTLKSGENHIKLILINIGVFLLIQFIQVLFFLFNKSFDTSIISNFLAVSSSPIKLLIKPWTLITYQFLHYDLRHIFFNLLMLFFGGKLFVEFLGTHRIISVYLFSGIAAALLFFIAYNVFPVFQYSAPNAVTIGASGSILGVVIAIATYIPNFTVSLFFLFEVRLKWIALAIVIIDIISISKGNAGGHLAHLGGALFGFTYAKQLKAGNDFLMKWSVSFDKIKSKWNKLFQKSPKNQYSNTAKQKKKEDLKNQELIDAILDKISKSGYDSLTKQEKEILFKASKE